MSVIRFSGIINNEDIGTATRQGSADRGRQPEPALGGLKLRFGRLSWIEPGTKNSLVEMALHQYPTITRELMRKLFRIAGSAAAVSHQVCDQCDRLYGRV